MNDYITQKEVREMLEDIKFFIETDQLHIAIPLLDEVIKLVKRKPIYNKWCELHTDNGFRMQSGDKCIRIRNTIPVFHSWDEGISKEKNRVEKDGESISKINRY